MVLQSVLSGVLECTNKGASPNHINTDDRRPHCYPFRHVSTNTSRLNAVCGHFIDCLHRRAGRSANHRRRVFWVWVRTQEEGHGLPTSLARLAESRQHPTRGLRGSTNERIGKAKLWTQRLQSILARHILQRALSGSLPRDQQNPPRLRMTRVFLSLWEQELKDLHDKQASAHDEDLTPLQMAHICTATRQVRCQVSHWPPLHVALAQGSRRCRQVQSSRDEQGKGDSDAMAAGCR